MSRPAALSWIPFLLLGLLTIATLGGPIAIHLTLRGGDSPRWPPDRDVEWWTFGLCTASVLVLLSACLLVGLVRWRRTVATRPIRLPRGVGE